MESSLGIVMLAAGKGKRMASAIPKPLMSVGGKPMINHCLEAVKQTRLVDKPLVVIHPEMQTAIQACLGNEAIYVYQKEQKGTGHAVQMTQQACKNFDDIMVLYSDHPLIQPPTLQKLYEIHQKEKNAITMITIQLPDFAEWRESFLASGRIKRNAGGKIEAIIEYKDASDEEKRITEINPSYFCFRADYLWQNIFELDNHNASGEFYLTDVVKIALEKNESVSTFTIEDAHEALGANTREQLALLERFLYNNARA